MTYIHPDDPVVQAFAKQLSRSGIELRTVCGELLAWFDHHVIYSRMNAPFFPLQRSDLDVLSMKSGTCGDYASLIVSVLTVMGFEAGYAYVRRDCYGDAQDHFCAAVLDGDAHILVDATQPYRKWHGFDCPHREYDLLSPAAFEARIKAEEQYWSDYAQRLNHPMLAGFLYAPWLHMERVEETDDILEQIFFLISCSDPSAPTLYAYYHQDRRDSRKLPVLAEIDKNGIRFLFSVRESDDLWDMDQWSAPYEEAQIPANFSSKALDTLKGNIPVFMKQAEDIFRQAGVGSLYEFARHGA